MLKGVGRIIPPGGQGEPEEDGSYAVHHILPMLHGVKYSDPDIQSAFPEIDSEAAHQPRNHGLPPLWHIPIVPPDTFVLIVPSAGTSSVVPVAFTERLYPPPPRPDPAPVQTATSYVIPTPVGQATIDRAASVISDNQQQAERLNALAQPSFLERLNPLYALLFYVAAGFGTLVLGDLETRYISLWSLLLIMGGALTLVDTRKRPRRITTSNLTWGVGIGFVIGLPLLILVAPGLSATSALLFPYTTAGSLFQTLVFLYPLAESIFFRGRLQQQHGMAVSIAGAGISVLLFFWPAGSHEPIFLVFVAFFLTVLSGVYSYVRARYGLAASFACQVTLNLMLFFLPRLIAPPIP
jgi:membrane protease YdiL (CAAX protease family)